MLLSINYLSTESSRDRILYNYTLVDKEYDKSFVLVEDSHRSVEDMRASTINGILDFIHQNYRSSKECPFVNIQRLYNKEGFGYNDSEFRKTEFYTKHSKVMDKILKPESITPADTANFDGYNNLFSGTLGELNTTWSITTTTTAGTYAYTAAIPNNVSWYTNIRLDGYGGGGGGRTGRRGGR